MIRKSLKKVISLLLVAVLTVSVAGCGSGGGENASNGDSADTVGSDGTQNTSAKGGTEGEDGPVAMGRYVEKEIDLSEQISYPMDLCRMEDGSLAIVDKSVGLLKSRDQGETWETETPQWFTDFRKEEAYISTMALAPDGTVAVSIGESGDDELDWNETLYLMLPDGTQVTVEAELSEDEKYFRQVVMGDDNRIFACARSSVWEIQRDGSAEKILSVDYTPQWFWVKDDLLFLDTDWDEIEAPAIYDMAAGEYVEDEVLLEFAKENYDDRFYNGRDYGTVQLLPGEDDTVYIAGKKGIHRHVIGGNMMEQIVDGNLSMLSNPEYYISDMMQLEGDEFLILFGNCKLLRFTYDPDIPSVPENMLTIYSLREDDNIRLAVSLYQMQHPDVYVSYTIGMGDDDSVTREDAIKKLNTELMAGEGPDLLVMDGLPIASYVDKGMLVELTDYFAQYSAADPLFDNVIEALKRGGKAYVAPAMIGIPQIAAAEAGMENVKDLSDFAKIVERLREEYPGKDILGISGERGILKRFAASSEPKWVSADGAIDKTVIGEYLEQCKRLFDAQMDGLDEKFVEEYESRNERMAEYYGMPMDEMDWDNNFEIFQYVAREKRTVVGWTYSQYICLQMLSLNRADGLEDTKVIPMQGQCSQVFEPITMLGISAASGQIDTAKGFMDTFLAADTQKEYDGFPLNQAAFDAQFTANPEYLGENGEYGSWVSTDEDGNMVQFQSWWPTDEQIAAVKKELSGVSTAYVPDQMLESAVFKQGVDYMRGDKTLDEALSEIEKAVAIYMAE